MKTLFATYVCGSDTYYEYVPYYVYSVLLTQPEAFVRIYSGSTLPDNVKKALKTIGDTRFEIVENFNLLKPVAGISDVRIIKATRWLLGAEHFKGYDCGYIGDVDFLIYKEAQTITNYHLQVCERTGLPFSNMVRPDRRLSGLHFIRCKEYFKKMQPVIQDAISNNVSKQLKLLTGVIRDEHILYELVREGCGDVGGILNRPHHGVHLGLLRNGELPKSYSKPHYLNFFEFREIHKIVQNKEVEKVIKIFS